VRYKDDEDGAILVKDGAKMVYRWINQALALLSIALGVFVIAVGLFGGRPQLVPLGSGLLVLGGIAALLHPARERFMRRWDDRSVLSWVVFMFVTLLGGVLAILLALASIESSGLELAIVLFPVGVFGLATAALAVRYILLLISESHAVRPFGFETFDKYDRDRRAKGWDIQRIANELGRTQAWVEGARRRYEGAAWLRRRQAK